MPKPSPRPPRAEPSAGRPRSTDATLAVREAALALACEGGAQFATVERIAARSGVAKTTIYRRWPNAASIVMEAFLAEIRPKIAYRHKGSLEETFAASIHQLVALLKGPRGDLLRQLLGASQGDPKLQQAFLENWIGPRRSEAMTLIAQARAAGEVAADMDADVLLDALHGAVYYRLMVPYEALSPGYARRMVRQVFEGVTGRRRKRAGG